MTNYSGLAALKATLPSPLTYRASKLNYAANPLPINWGAVRAGLLTPVEGLELAVKWPDPEWSTIASSRLPRYGHASAATNARVLVMGGRLGDAAGTTWNDWTNTLEGYDIATGKWVDLAPCPIPLTAAVGQALIGNVWYIAGGANGAGAPVSTLYAYDIASNTWSTKTPLPGPARQGGLVGGARNCQRNGKMYVFGGITADGTPSALAYSYDPMADAWTRLADLPVALYGHGTCRIGPNLYVAGGSTGVGDTQRKLYEYSVPNDAWTTRSQMPAARMDLVVRPLGNKLVTAGGRLYGGQGYADTWRWDPVVDSWSFAQVAPRPFYGASAAAVSEVAASIITGGTSGTDYPTSVLQFGPRVPDQKVPAAQPQYQLFPAGVPLS